METTSGRKRRGSTTSFMKTKVLMPFYRSPPPANTPPKQTQPNPNVQYYSSSKVTPYYTTSSTTTTTTTPSASSSAVLLPHNTVSFVAAAGEGKPRRQQVDHNKFFGVVGDCRIDSKASTYISAVQERFKQLDRVDSDRLVIIDQAS